MGIFKKIEDVFRVNLNDLLDKATNPIKELNLMLEDLKDFRVKQVKNISGAVAALKMVEADLAETKESVSRWQKRAERYAGENNDELAKKALKQQVQLEKLAATLESAVKTNTETVEKLKTDLTVLDEKVSYLESQRSVIEVRVRTAKATKSIHGPISGHGGAPRTDEILDRVDNKVKRMEAEASASEEIADLAVPENAEKRFGKEELDDEVEQRLAALKAKKG